MSDNPLIELERIGQSVWLDFIRRALFSGELAELIKEDGLSGITSNPSIFEKAIGGSRDYDESIRELARDDLSAAEIYERLTLEDVQRAADILRPVHERAGGRDGFVSLEVSPELAYDAVGTIAEARRLWREFNRPNALIKVPATREGLAAIRQLTGEGINVNVTLLFGLPRYREIAEAYIGGLEDRAAAGRPLGHLTSVASFFLSRIDVLVDPMLEALGRQEGPAAETARQLRGEAATASAKVASRLYHEIFDGDRFARLRAQGAHSQHLLWASTSTKSPAYSDIKYVEPLIGPNTINTLPMETINAYRDHGSPAPRLDEGVDRAEETLKRLASVGIDIDAATARLEKEGVDKFNQSYKQLLDTLEKKRAEMLAVRPDRQTLAPGRYQVDFEQLVGRLDAERFASRLWRKDPSLWSNDPGLREQIHGSLGWLHVAEKMEDHVDELILFAREVKTAGFKRVVHMGMGGSSLAPLVMGQSIGSTGGGLPLSVLDTTDPATILALEREAPLEDTLFIVASKSGTTAEPRAFEEYFFDKVKLLKGDRAGDNFIAITDPGTPLEQAAAEKNFRRIFLNFADIGGRYSALSYFGLVPAALAGIDVQRLLSQALRMLHACVSSVPLNQNPGIVLGAFLGGLQRRGRDKVTFISGGSPATLGMWLEQLLAESTGKEGTGLLPVAGEAAGDPSAYGDDRVFIHFRLAGNVDQGLDRKVEALTEAGHPVATIIMDDIYGLGQEFLRWEIATATAGAIIGINPFDQPNVQESKDNTNRLLDQVREKGALPHEEPDLVSGALGLYLNGAVPRELSVAAALEAFFKQAAPGDYLALMAYLRQDEVTDTLLASLRTGLGRRLHVATTLGYGPRFLHSTGQFHKGGPGTGLFLQLTSDDMEDAPIPGSPYGFSVFKQAQALGDLEALRRHGRRAIRIHLGMSVPDGLRELEQSLRSVAMVS